MTSGPNEQARIAHLAETNAKLTELRKRKLELLTTILLDATASCGVNSEQARAAWAKRIAREYRAESTMLLNKHIQQFPD